MKQLEQTKFGYFRRDLTVSKNGVFSRRDFLPLVKRLSGSVLSYKGKDYKNELRKILTKKHFK